MRRREFIALLSGATTGAVVSAAPASRAQQPTVPSVGYLYAGSPEPSAPLLQAKLTTGLPAELREAIPGLRTDAQRAITFVRSLPVVTAALVGMRRPAHVDENLGALR